MKVGIIGGGSAGLVSAWLLEEQHEVTLFERSSHLGGHAESLVVDCDDRSIVVDLGAYFFSRAMNPHFVRLLELLDVPTQPYGQRIHFRDARDEWKVSLPPTPRSWPEWVRPRTVKTLLAYRRLLDAAEDLCLDGDWSLTLEEFTARAGCATSFLEDFLFPFVGCTWGIFPEQARQLSARNALGYSVLHRADKRTVEWLDITGGASSYVDRLTGDLDRAQLEAGVEVTGVEQRAGCWWVHRLGRDPEPFDVLVVATNAEHAAASLSGLSGAEKLSACLGEFEYFDTEIAVHRDPRWMPRRRADWALANLRFDGEVAPLTHWAGWRSGVDVFRTWVTHLLTPPENAYARRSYRHPNPTPAYFAAQSQLGARQGEASLWFAGVYTRGYDCHESAVASAVRIGEALAPGSPRLAAIQGAG